MPSTAFDPNFNMETETYEGTVKFKIPVRVAEDAAVGSQKIAIDVLYQTFDDTTCLLPHVTHLFVPINIEQQSIAKPTALSGTTPNSGIPPSKTANTELLDKAVPSQAPANNQHPARSRDRLVTKAVAKHAAAKSVVRTITDTIC